MALLVASNLQAIWIRSPIWADSRQCSQRAATKRRMWKRLCPGISFGFWRRPGVDRGLGKFVGAGLPPPLCSGYLFLLSVPQYELAGSETAPRRGENLIIAKALCTVPCNGSTLAFTTASRARSAQLWHCVHRIDRGAAPVLCPKF